MPIIDFPPIEEADQNGLLAIGGDLSLESLTLAYSRGIYPWPISPEFPMTWFSPNPRGVIPCEEFHLSKSLLKTLKRQEYKISYSENFEEIVRMCQKAHANSGDGTWITEEIISGYKELFDQKYAYCLTVLDKDNDEIIGGIYGVSFGQFVSGESMFHLKPNASKIALAYLLSLLKIKGIKYLDTQMVTETTKTFGAINISRNNFKKYVQKTFSLEKDNIQKNKEILTSINW